MNKMIVLHGLESAFSEAFRLKQVGVGAPMPDDTDALKYQIAFLMMSGYTAGEAIAILGYGVKKGLIEKYGEKWFLKIPTSELKKLLSEVRREGLNGIGEVGELGLIPKRWIPKRLRKLQIGKAIGKISRDIIAPVAQVTGLVLTATGVGAPIGAAVSAGGVLVGTLAKEGGPKASEVANAVLGVAAAASGQGTLPTGVQKIVDNALNRNPEISRVATQIRKVINDPQVNAAVNEMKKLIPNVSYSEIRKAVPENFMAISTTKPLQTDLKTVTTADMRALPKERFAPTNAFQTSVQKRSNQELVPVTSQASSQSTSSKGKTEPKQAGTSNFPILIGGLALLGVGFLLLKK